MSETLRAYIALHGLDEVAVMNELQDHGVISDNAVSVADVGNGDRLEITRARGLTLKSGRT